MTYVQARKTVLAIKQTEPHQIFTLPQTANCVTGIELQNVTMSGVTSLGTTLIATILELGGDNESMSSIIRVPPARGIGAPIAWIQPAGPPARNLQLPPIYNETPRAREIPSITLVLGSELGGMTTGATFGVGWYADWQVILTHAPRL